jgi:excisionase family DNA binding protein
VHNLPALRRRWDTLELVEQRAILRSEIAHVTVHPAVQRGRVFDERRVEITWVDNIIDRGYASGCMTTREAADRLGISPRTLRRWVADGKCRPEKLGTVWLFRRNDLDGLVREMDVTDRAHQKAAGGRGRS